MQTTHFRRWGRTNSSGGARKPFRQWRRMSLNEVRAWHTTMLMLRVPTILDSSTLLNHWGHFCWRDHCFRVGKGRYYAYA